MKMWHENVAWRCGMKMWHEDVAWKCGMKIWRENVTWKCDMKMWHENMAWRCGMNVHICWWLLGLLWQDSTPCITFKISETWTMIFKSKLLHIPPSQHANDHTKTVLATYVRSPRWPYLLCNLGEPILTRRHKLQNNCLNRFLIGSM
jgi:hypothetical protein